MEVGKKTIKDIFNGKRVLEIPFFQRSYIWTKEHWERFLDDMRRASKTDLPYFLGSMILKQQLTDTNIGVGDKRTVIDGQQRMTTLNIFCKVLALKAGQNNIIKEVFNTDGALTLRYNYINRNSFNEIMNLTEIKDFESKDKDNVIAAYEYFKKELQRSEFELSIILENILFVVIDLNETEDEQQIFDAINSLGVKLTTAELLKNYFFGNDDIANYEKY